MADHGFFHWNELMTNDPAKAKRFYKSTLGWSYEAMKMPGGSYTIVKSGDKMVGGIFDTRKTEMAKMPEQWFAYIAVDDIDKRLAKAKKAGAKVMREPFEIPGTGRIAILQQPGGGMIGWMTPVPM